MNTIVLSILAAITCFAGAGKNANGKLTDALDDTAWERSEWISAANAPIITGAITESNERAADGASWFVTTITTDKKIVTARWMTTGLGTYDLYINGKLIGSEMLKPGFTHIEKTRRSFTYDITDILNATGTNVLAAEVTPGWWADKIVTPAMHQGMNGTKPAFRSVLELTFADGTTKYYGTNTTDWLAGVAGPVTHAAIFDGEEYDARIAPGYETLEKLSTPEINTEFSGEILPTAGAEIYLRPDLALMPVKAYVWSQVSGKTNDAHGTVEISKEFAPGEEMTIAPGETLVIDFGQNAAAVPAFVFNAAEGVRLHVRPGELLNDGNGALSRGMDGPEGSVHRLNLRTPDTAMLLDYTFGSNDGYTTYIPRHTFFGYRFLSITAENDPVAIKELVSLPVSSITAAMETGRISTGNELVNKLISNTIWGLRSNYLSVSTDCPQRNERLGWTADTQVFSRTGSFFANTVPFFHKWMRDMRDTQDEFGSYPSVAPYGQYGSEPTDMMRLGWADAGVIVPWTIWHQFGDSDIIDENWDAMEKYMAHIAKHKYAHSAYTAQNNDFQYGDWLSYEALESCGGSIKNEAGDYYPETIEYWDYLGASYWAIDVQMMADMAAATGRDTSGYDGMAAEARAYLKEHFLNEDGSFKSPIFNTMQTPPLFALKNRLLDGNARDAMADRLRKNFAEHGNCLQTGFLGTSILMPTLTDNGMTDIAYELLFQRKNPSWLYSVDNGATTIWERWNSYMIENGMGPRGMNSFNHYAYGCVCEWIWETAAGIAADKKSPGFKHIIMKPVPDKRLGSVDAEYPSAAGTIRSSWRYDNDGTTWTWNFTIPDGATASVTAPGETEPTEYTPGTYTIVKKF